MGGGKTQDLPPAPVPTIVPTFTKTESTETEQQRTSKISNLRRGMMSTMKAPLTADLQSNVTGKKTLGGA